MRVMNLCLFIAKHCCAFDTPSCFHQSSASGGCCCAICPLVTTYMSQNKRVRKLQQDWCTEADASEAVDLVLVRKKVLPRVDLVSWRCLMKIKSNCSYSDLFLMHLPVTSCIMCTSISSLRLCGVFAALIVTSWSRL